MSKKPPIMVRGLLTVYGVYETLKPEIMLYSGSGWNENTTSQYDGIVLNHLVPNLQSHDVKHIGLFGKQDYEEALNRLIKQGKNGPGEPFEPWDEDGIPEKVSFLMRAIVWAASNHTLCDDVFCPLEITRSGGSRERTGEQQARNRKSLTVKQEIAIHRYLILNLEFCNSIAGLMLMYAFGLRNNEACGINFGYIREFSEYPGHYFLIVPQSTELGANSLKIMGKTKNSGRRIPMPASLAKRLIALQDKRVKLAIANGYTVNGEDLPIACKIDKPWERCSSDDLSLAARKMYETVGMRMADIVTLNQDLMEELQVAKEEMEEDEFREIERDPTCYLLRRNFATHIAALGLTDAEIRYILGHKIEDEYVHRRAFGDEKMLFRIKRKLDERPLLNDVQLEEHIPVLPGKKDSINGSKRIVLNLPGDQLSCVRINLTAKEPGDEIRFKILDNQNTANIHAELVAYSQEPSDAVSRTTNIMRYYHHSYQK